MPAVRCAAERSREKTIMRTGHGSGYGTTLAAAALAGTARRAIQVGAAVLGKPSEAVAADHRSRPHVGGAITAPQPRDQGVCLPVEASR